MDEQGASTSTAVEMVIGLPFEGVGPNDGSVQVRPRQILRQSCQTTFGAVQRSYVVARCDQLHGLAAGCGARSRTRRAGRRDETRGERRCQILHPPTAFGISWQGSNLGRRDSAMKRRERDSVRKVVPDTFACKAQIERSPLENCAPGCVDSILTPCSGPAFLDVGRKAGFVILRQAAPEQCPQDAVNQSPRTAVDEWQCGRDDGMIGGVETDLLR